MKILLGCSKRILVAVILILVMGTSTCGDTFLLVVEGINKDVDDMQSKGRSVSKLRKVAIRQMKISPGRLKILTYKDSLVKSADGVSDAATITETLRTFSEKIRPVDRFILYYTGQANAVKQTLRLNLPGPDITGQQLAGFLKTIKAECMLVILDCPNAGLALKSLTGPGRIVLCSSRHDQPYSPRFSDYFISAMVASESDLNQDGKISLLETLQQSARKIDQFYRDRHQLKTENFLLEDNGDGIPNQKPWIYDKNTKDGLRTSEYFWKG